MKMSGNKDYTIWEQPKTNLLSIFQLLKGWLPFLPAEQGINIVIDTNDNEHFLNQCNDCQARSFGKVIGEDKRIKELHLNIVVGQCPDQINSFAEAAFAARKQVLKEDMTDTIAIYVLQVTSLNNLDYISQKIVLSLGEVADYHAGSGDN